ncbi:MAG: serine protease [Bacteroidia bacterium]
MVKQFYIFLLSNLIIYGVSHAQVYQGSGVIINNTGDIITNAHVIGGQPKAIIVENDSGKRFQATIKSIDIINDIALISIEQETKYFAYLRMDNTYENALLPVLKEEVNIIGYPEGEFASRGGLISRLSSPKFFNDGFSIGLSTTYGCSGAPILDERGLLIGLLWGGANDDGSYTTSGKPHLTVYGLNANIIIPFIINAKVMIGTSNKNNAPFGLINYPPLERIDRIINWGSRFTVKIFCVQ